MKRTGFKRPTMAEIRAQAEIEREARREAARAARPPLVPSAAMHRGVYASTYGANTFPKRDYVRSSLLLERIRALGYCTFCAAHTKVYPCHGNWSDQGKGGHIKADDNTCAAGCADCHRELDQGSRWSYAERRARHAAALARTVLMLQGRCEWPAGVPVPAMPDLEP